MHDAARMSSFDGLLRQLWVDRMERGGFFFYQLRRKELDADTKLTTPTTSPVDPPFCVQFNRHRGTRKRRGVHVSGVRMPFDLNSFNFLRVKLEEVLFMLPSALAPDLGAAGLTPVVSLLGRSPHLVVINASPIEELHVLFCPRTFDRLPQQLTPDTLEAALSFASLTRDPQLRMGFNSLGGAASVNHLHFHVYHLAHQLPIDVWPTRVLRQVRGGSLCELAGYPLPGLCFMLRADDGNGDSADDSTCSLGGKQSALPSPAVLSMLHACIGALQRHNIAHNIAVTHCGTRVNVWPRQIMLGVNQDGGLQGVGCMEMMGHFIAFDEASYDEITHQQCLAALDAVAVAPELFEVIKQETLASCDGNTSSPSSSDADAACPKPTQNAKL